MREWKHRSSSYGSTDHVGGLGKTREWTHFDEHITPTHDDSGELPLVRAPQPLRDIIGPTRASQFEGLPFQVPPFQMHPSKREH